MKTEARLPLAKRNPERGAIAFVVAAMWMVLFGLAAFAVDLGYRYQSKFGLQAAADSAVRAAMPKFVNDDLQGAHDSAIAMASANGYTSGVTTNASGNLFQVDISVTPPSFFLGLFGSANSFPLGATSIGEKLSNPSAVLLALSTDCLSEGLNIHSDSGSTFNGNIESNGPLGFNNSPTISTVNGSILSMNTCGGPKYNGSPAPPVGANVVTGSVSTVSVPFPNPFQLITPASFTCTNGTSLATSNNPPVIALGGPGGTSDLIPPGVYCSSTAMWISDAGTKQIWAPNVTFVSMSTIQIGADSGVTMSPNALAPSNIVVYSFDNTPCATGQAVNMGLNYFNITGSAYVPNGCLRAGGKVLNLNGSLVANELDLAPDPQPPGWTIGTGGGGGGGTSWRMHK
jgi:hypothetical protein